MSATTSIEWTDPAWLTAARRCGLSLEEYRTNIEAGLKRCWRCRVWKPIDQFCADRSRGDGRSARCMACRRKPKQLRLIRPTPAERDRVRYATDVGYRLERREHTRSRKHGVQKLTADDIGTILEGTDGLCLYCDRPHATLDHIVAVSRGGSTRRSNLGPACVSCNSRKRDMDVHDFIDKYDIPLTRRLEQALDLAASVGDL